MKYFLFPLNKKGPTLKHFFFHDLEMNFYFLHPNLYFRGVFLIILLFFNIVLLQNSELITVLNFLEVVMI